jgi:hypothetical protein
MVSKNLILSKVQPFLNQQNVVIENQGVNDIITGILTTHNKYKKEYDKIYIYYVDDDIEETCRNIFQFLKDNVPYYIESNDLQFLKSPASILSTKSDCKSYALFSCGILDAYLRNEKPNYELSYRFASYDPFDKTPQHVFCVVKANGKEYWIDPVLDRFNQRKQPNFYKDKIVNDMALVGLSGTSVEKYDTANMMTENGSVGATSWTNILDTLVKGAPSIITATQGQQSSSPSYIPTQQPQQSTGISTNTLLMIGGVGLLAFFLLRKK